MQKIWRFYGVVWAVILLIYGSAIAYGDLASGRFEVLQVLRSTLVSIGSAPFLLLPLWSLTGRLEARRLGAISLFAIHSLGAVVFSGVWHALQYVLTGVFISWATANSWAGNFYLFQFIWGLLMYGSVAAAFHATRALEQVRLQAIAQVRSESLLVRAELTALRNKLNPHFLFNTLHSVIALVRKDQKQAEATLLQFSDMLRYVLETEKSGEDVVTLADELNFVRNYLNLEALRLGNRLTVDWQVEEVALRICVPALSIQPIVENSIKHAFNPRTEPGTLSVHAALSADKRSLNVTVSDNGPGCDDKRVDQRSGLGVSTVRRRLELEYGGHASLVITTAPGQGFSAALTFPTTS